MASCFWPLWVLSCVLFFGNFVYGLHGKGSLHQYGRLLSVRDTNSVSDFVDRQILSIRGGSKPKGDVKKTAGKQVPSMLTKVKDTFAGIKPVSRAFLLLSLFCSVFDAVGLPGQALFGLNLGRVLELWRPLTSIAYLGPPSISMANSLFFLLRFGQTIEQDKGSGPYAWFLIVQTIMLTVLGWVLGFPFLAQSMISSIIYECSRMNAMERIPFQFGLVITSWQLPFCMMAIDCLTQQSLSAAWPHVLGILTGHVYHFCTTVWPSLGGTARLTPPQWIVNKLGDKPSPLDGLVFKNDGKKKKSSSRQSSKPPRRDRKLGN